MHVCPDYMYLSHIYIRVSAQLAASQEGLSYM
jgi:hypothetical protein